MYTPTMKGKVYVIGAGAGDPDLLTVQATRLLRNAEVVLHDDEVATEILAVIPASTQVRNTGKLGVPAAQVQEKIHSLLISAAREGHQVVHLTARDPLLSGRPAEEMEALARAGVAFEVISAAEPALGAAAGAA